VERSTATQDRVRCLDCGAEYHLEIDDEGAEPCPECGAVGWVAVVGARRAASADDDS
jgi:predicted RNA-binding Zn-ribbon protein involved in translation (DUF1610 family)